MKTPKTQKIRTGNRVRGARGWYTFVGIAEIVKGRPGMPDRVRIVDDRGNTLALLYADECSKV